MHDPILERTLRRVRAESARAHRRRGGVVAATGAVVLAGVLVCGLRWGHDTVPGEQRLTAEAGGVHMTATVSPADGWVRLHATVTGLRPDERCHLVVTDSRGRRFVAGGWVTTRGDDTRGGDTGDGDTRSGDTRSDDTGGDDTGDDTTLSGAALVAPSEVASISVVALSGQVLLTATP